MACKALDGQVAAPADNELQGLLDRFVCVRLVQMHGVDLAKFEFDGSLTWAAFFMNGDGTIYGRYGSRSGLRNLSEKEISLTGFKKSIRGALALHKRYGKDKEAVGKSLAGKLSTAKPRWPKPEAIPSLKDNKRFNKPFVGHSGVRAGCIHCHMVPTNELKSLRAAELPIPDRLFFPYPLPNALGMNMDKDEMATVKRVRPESIAAKAGLKDGDVVLKLGRQPILSPADIQWVLHNAADKDSLVAEIRRGESTLLSAKLELPQNWRRSLNDWRFINPGLLRQLLGFNVRAIPRRRANRMGLKGKMAFVVNQTTRPLRMQTGIGNKDMIVAIDDMQKPMTVGQLTAYVFRKKPKGSKLKITIMQLTDRLPRPEHTVEVTVK